MRTRICLVVFVLISALGARAQQNSQQTPQQNPAAQALLQWLHQNSYDHGQYEGTFTATPQQLLDA